MAKRPGVSSGAGAASVNSRSGWRGNRAKAYFARADNDETPSNLISRQGEKSNEALGRRQGGTRHAQQDHPARRQRQSHDELAEILVIGHEHAVVGERAFEYRSVSLARRQFGRPDDIVSRGAQGVDE
jgi:hypothetical protein